MDISIYTCLLGWSGRNLCFTEREPGSLASDAIFMSRIWYFGFSAAGTVHSAPSRGRKVEGGWVEEGEGEIEEGGVGVGGLSWKTHSQLWLFTSLWHIYGCFHGDGSKDSWDVSEIQCAERCWLLDVTWRMNMVHRKWERRALAHHYLSLNLWEKSTPAARQMLLLFLGTGCFVCFLLSLGNDTDGCTRHDASS